MRSRVKVQYGFSMLETVVVLAIFGIMTAITVSNMHTQDHSATSSANLITMKLKEVRLKALQSTQAYTIEPASATRLTVKSSNKCSDSSQQIDPSLDLYLPKGTSFSNTTWSICFDARGFSNNYATIVVNDQFGGTESLQVLLGGATRKL